MLKFVTFLVFAMSLLKCGQNRTRDDQPSAPLQTSVDSLFYAVWEDYQIDDSTDGMFLHYDCISDSLVITYGNKTFKSLVPREFLPGSECIFPTSRVPLYLDHNDNYMILGFSCGMPCWAMTVCPLNPADSIYTIGYQLAYDLDAGIVAYWDEENTSDVPRIIVENMQTRKQQFIEYAACDHVFSGFCVDRAEIKDRELVVSYFTSASGDSSYVRTYQIML